jgi:hypothetical protein
MSGADDKASNVYGILTSAIVTGIVAAVLSAPDHCETQTYTEGCPAYLGRCIASATCYNVLGIPTIANGGDVATIITVIAGLLAAGVTYLYFDLRSRGKG